MDVLFNKQQLAARLTSDDVDLINDFLNTMETSLPKTDRQLIMMAFETGLSKKQPKEVSKPEDIQKIAALTARINELEAALANKPEPEKIEIEKIVEKPVDRIVEKQLTSKQVIVEFKTKAEMKILEYTAECVSRKVKKTLTPGEVLADLFIQNVVKGPVDFVPVMGRTQIEKFKTENPE